MRLQAEEQAAATKKAEEEAAAKKKAEEAAAAKEAADKEAAAKQAADVEAAAAAAKEAPAADAAAAVPAGEAAAEGGSTEQAKDAAADEVTTGSRSPQISPFSSAAMEEGEIAGEEQQQQEPAEEPEPPTGESCGPAAHAPPGPPLSMHSLHSWLPGLCNRKQGRAQRPVALPEGSCALDVAGHASRGSAGRGPHPPSNLLVTSPAPLFGKCRCTALTRSLVLAALLQAMRMTRAGASGMGGRSCSTTATSATVGGCRQLTFRVNVSLLVWTCMLLASRVSLRWLP